MAKNKPKGRIVAKRVIKRIPGNLYYLDGEGNVRQSPMKRKAKGGGGKK